MVRSHAAERGKKCPLPASVHFAIAINPILHGKCKNVLNYKFCEKQLKASLYKVVFYL